MMMIEKDNVETTKELNRISNQKDPFIMMENKKARNKHLYQKLKMRLSHLASVNGKLVPDTDDLADMHANIFERNRKHPPKHTRIIDEDLPNSQKLFKNIQKKTM